MTDAPARWAVVVVNYESGALLARCVESLLADTSAGGPPELVVVDNASCDDSVARLRAAHPEVRVVPAPGNVGYAAAANLGVAATSAPVVAICNPDLEVDAGAAGVLLDRFDADPGLGAAGPLVRRPDGTVYPSARAMPVVRDAVGHGLLGMVWPANPFTRRYRRLDADPAAARDADWVSGSAIWMRRRALDEIGGWDERFFMYMEDVDVCLRLRDAGWRIAYEPRAAVTHVQGASTQHRPYRMIVEHHRSMWRFACKRWRGAKRVLLLPAALYLMVRVGLALLAQAVRGRSAASGGRGVNG